MFGLSSPYVTTQRRQHYFIPITVFLCCTHYLSNNICEPFTIGNDIQISENLNSVGINVDVSDVTGAGDCF